MTTITCIGPVLGTYTEEEEARAADRPVMAGHAKRGIEVEEKIYARDQNGAVVLDNAGEPVIDRIETRIVPCGQDLTALYAEVPADGQEHFVRCPKCGNVGRVTKHPPETTGG